MYCTVTMQLLSVLKTIQDEQKKPKLYGPGQMLFHAEINVLLNIDRNEGLKVGDLAKALGITKGAATQQVSKLEEKGLVEVYMVGQNRKEKHLRISPLGRDVLAEHERMHDQANAKLRNFFCGLDESDLRVIREFLALLDENPSFCDFVCENNRSSCDRRKE